MSLIILVGLIGLIVGTMIGTVGIGGVLLAPSLVFLLGMDLPLAMATSMWSFLFTGLMGVVVYGRKGSIDWAMSGWLVLGIIPASIVGARTNVSLPTNVLAGILVAVLLYSAWNALVKQQLLGSSGTIIAPHWLVCIGIIVGFGSALTGTGGAVMLMPIFLLLSVPVLKAVGVVQGIQLPIAISASIGFVLFGQVDLMLGTALGFVQAVGVWIGAQVAHRVHSERLRGFAAVALIVSAVLLVRQIILG
ncbi:MAG: sulfite exporter TauE/SafE family protein [Chloroflexota bacterium]